MSGDAGEPAAPDAAARKTVAPTPHLAAPAAEFHASFLTALREYHAEGRHAELDEVLLADPSEFARYVKALSAGAVQLGEPGLYLAELQGRPAPEPPRDGYSPQTVLWWVAGDEYLGRVSIRHVLTPSLFWEGGNIGYEVRPSARRRGHATAMLAAALPLAAALGVDPARIDCDAGNSASRRTIEKNGGMLEEARGGSLYFWLPTT